MVAGQIAERRSEFSVVDALIVPRPIVRFLFAVVCLGMAELAWHLLDIKVLATVSGGVGPFCLLAATALWSLRSKVDDVLGGQDLGAEGYLQTREKATTLRRRLMLRAAWVTVCALGAFVPVLSQQIAHAMWEGTVLVAGLSVAEAAYNFLIAHHWDEQLREFRDERKLHKMRDEERKAVIARIEGSQTSTDDERVGWETVNAPPPTRQH